MNKIIEVVGTEKEKIEIIDKAKRCIESESLADALGANLTDECFKNNNDINNEVLSGEQKLIIAFVQGAKWWEYQKKNATMWQSDQSLAETKAREMLENGRLGINSFKD